jgi:hypothetical protein
MSANRLFLVCAHHPKLEDAFCIGERANGEGQYVAPNMKRMDDWYAKHMGCGRGCDHFKLAYHRTQDWDISPPAEQSIAGGVRLALVNGSH